MGVWFWGDLQIDRLGMTKSPLDKDHSEFLWGQMQWFAYEGQDVLPGWKMTLKPCDHYTVLTFRPPHQKRPVASVILGSSKKFAYATMTIYPARFVPQTFTSFQEATSLLLGPYGYGRMFDEALVSYIEVAADSWTVPRSDILPMRLGVQTSKVWPQNDGSIGQVMLGSVNSPKRLRVYDKKRQLLEKMGETVPQGTLTRIEVVRRYTGLPAQGLSALPNLFEGWVMVSLVEAMKQSSDETWMAFLAFADAYGIPAALAMYPSHRKAFRSRLKKAAASWWLPQTRWQSFKAAIDRLRPTWQDC